MKNGENLTIVSPGTQKRNFTHINDTVDALILIGKDGYGDEYGIGNSQGYTILEVAQMFGGNIDMLQERKGNRMVASVVSDKTKALGWKPKIDLKDYIDEQNERIRKSEYNKRQQMYGDKKWLNKTNYTLKQ